MLPAAKESLGALCRSHLIGGCSLLTTCTMRLGHSLASAASSWSSMEEPAAQQQRPRSSNPNVRRWAAAASVPATLPEVPARPSSHAQVPLSSINDPDNWGLGVSPQGTGEPAYYWQGSSISNPKLETILMSGPRASAPSSLRPQGFRTAQTRPTMQRIVFRSSMLDPDHPAGSGQQ